MKTNFNHNPDPRESPALEGLTPTQKDAAIQNAKRGKTKRGSVM